MTQSPLFSSGLQLASFVISSGLLPLTWNALTTSEQVINSKEGVRLSYKVHSGSFHEKDLKIIAFETQDHDVQLDLVSSSFLQETNFHVFDFLLTESNTVFSVNKSAVSLLQENHDILAQLKNEFSEEVLSEKGLVKSFSSNPLIVTGSGLAGSVAYLFTLFLLDIVGSGINRPFCITFGTPLIGDKKLQQAISRSSTWNSCFLNVVSHKDPPRLFITNQTNVYTPFGAFLFSSDAGSTSSENPDLILELLVALGSTHVQTQGFRSNEYGNIVKSLYSKVICKDRTAQAENINLSDSLHASISLQLLALGLTPLIQDSNSLEKIKTLEKNFIILRTTKFDPSRKLNEMKKYMTELERYKKVTKNEGIGYYDSYRNMYSSWDIDVNGLQKTLTRYWEKMVEEAEMKPQKEGSKLRTSWLYAGTNYRRMVEPLVIAHYYRGGDKDYVTRTRSKHFEKLENWLKEGKTANTSNLNSTTEHNVESILTLDSCFWAHVEDALIACKEFRESEEEEAKNTLDAFERYVYKSLKNYEVSVEIFLPKSSYMSWWKEYIDVMGSSYDSNSNLAIFMGEVGNYDQYAKGTYVFP